MNTKTEPGPAPMDTAKLIAASVVMLAGIVAYYYYGDASTVVRVLALLGALIVALVIAALTDQGRQFLEFFQDSQVELRKVIWPTQQETMQTSLLVLAFTLAMGVFFLIVDTVLLKITQLLTGQGG
jgi:preprotein translocase subunit SecE